MIPSPGTRAGDLLVDDLAALARIPSAVPLGEEALIEPDHPTLQHYVQKHLRPAFLRLGTHDIIDLPRNQFAVRLGDGDGPCLALMAYTPTQHHNLMAEPWSGRIRTPVELGVDETLPVRPGRHQWRARCDRPGIPGSGYPVQCDRLHPRGLIPGSTP